MKKLRGLLRFWYLPLLSFYAMEAVHEAGHVLFAWISGGTVRKVVLLPWELSRTELATNPHPLFVAWGGVVCGMLLPLLLWLAFRRAACAHILRFFAGFCLVANGIYLGFGAFLRAGDCRELLMYGTPFFLLPLIGFSAAAAGFALWNGLGKRFGLSEENSTVRNEDIGE